jgi:hypothetical protein
MFAPLPKLPERSRGQLLREAIPADYLNAIAASIAELDRRTRALAPVASPDLVPATGPGGTTYALRRRTRAAAAAGHPWKATATGTENIAIAPGCVVGYRPRDVGADFSANAFNTPLYGVHIKFAGGTVAIPTDAETGVIYYALSTSDNIEAYYVFPDNEDYIHMSFLHRPLSGTPVFGPLTPNGSAFLDPDFSLPGSATIYIPIAEVSIEEGVAQVDYQILTHNPHIWLDLPSLQTSPT